MNFLKLSSLYYQIVLILSVTLIFFTIGRMPFLIRKRQRQMLLVSIALFVLTFIYVYVKSIKITDSELLLLFFISIISFVVGVKRKNQRGSRLFEERSHELITVEEYMNKGVRIIKRGNRILSGIYLSTLKPTSSVLWYPHLTELFPYRPMKVLCIGGGACAYPIYATSKDEDLAIDIIEIDTVIIEAARKHFPVPENNKVRLINADGLNWIKNNKTKYDLIFIDVGIVITHKNNFYNNNFLSNGALINYRKLLDNKGTIIINIITTRKKKDISKVSEKLKRFEKVFKSNFAFQTTLKASDSDIQDIIYIFSKQQITIPNLMENLIKINKKRLSYPKTVYRTLLSSLIIS